MQEMAIIIHTFHFLTHLVLIRVKEREVLEVILDPRATKDYQVLGGYLVQYHGLHGKAM
jgi:hypothetical protein